MKTRLTNSEELVLDMRRGVAVCSISQLAKLLQVDRATVTKCIKNHGIMPGGERRGNPVYPLPAVSRKLFSKFY